MANIHSVNQILYFGTGVATPVSEGKGFTVSAPTDFAEDSSWGDSFKTKIPGLSDFSGRLMKHYDHSETSLRTAALNRTVGNFYWYPDRNTPANYWFWTGYVALDSMGAGGLNEIIESTYSIVAATQPAVRP